MRSNLIKKHNESGAKPKLSAESIYVLEKGREIGAHQLSGAIMNPKALAELVPDFEESAPLDTPVTDSAVLLFTKNSSFRFPITPPPFQNKGNYVVSLSKITKWLGGLVEAADVNVFKEFGGAELVYEGDGIARTSTSSRSSAAPNWFTKATESRVSSPRTKVSTKMASLRTTLRLAMSFAPR